MKVLITPRGFATYGLEQVERMRALGLEVDYNDTGLSYDAETFLAKAKDADAIIVGVDDMSDPVLEQLPRLKAVCKFGVGTDNIGVSWCEEHGVAVGRTVGSNSLSVAEHALALMFCDAKLLYPYLRDIKAGGWNKGTGIELAGKTIGIVGFGAIGRLLAGLCHGIGMRVLAYDVMGVDEAQAAEHGAEVATFDEIIEGSDYVSVHVPLLDSTRDLIAADEMRRMRDTACIVNCARGGIIDEADLAEALKQGIVAAAAIDVYTREPPAEKGNPLLEAPNIVLTPHLGASTVEAQIGVSVDVAKGIIAALHGEPVATAVNMAPVSPQVMRVIAPYLTLAERLGGTVVGLADGPIESVEVTYNGEITEVNTGLLTTAVIKGLLNPVMENEVNYVNAPGLAKERGIKVSERKDRASEDFANLITVDVVAGGQKLSVQGTLFGTQGRIVRINDFRVDVDPHARILICPHINRPGVIGTVGTLLGGNGVNISAMQVGTTEEEGKNLMVLTVDNDIPSALLETVKALDGIFDAKLVNFYEI